MPMNQYCTRNRLFLLPASSIASDCIRVFRVSKSIRLVLRSACRIKPPILR
ncbi:uncharacterized protein MELLADRAFT_87942 [Melampsora larici-populina 98AG31]|uniref:Uncharacterized protein n=1 Tax=Melampsora larici-populina (strain 98AG31 / pathotype 3-4-7) TaxID=747676 RepID=F4SE21_MELLP|nr:uncharacterized protein MELLADRAFT_87942 [Melampsora larici-populina 98AG31]EGF97104.1 hypothetical protein MELLADRAFT_87942 [Melampsora larici-populina 98AG31]